jgi:hypothetical protein
VDLAWTSETGVGSVRTGVVPAQAVEGLRQQGAEEGRTGPAAELRAARRRGPQEYWSAFQGPLTMPGGGSAIFSALPGRSAPSGRDTQVALKGGSERRVRRQCRMQPAPQRHRGPARVSKRLAGTKSAVRTTLLVPGRHSREASPKEDRRRTAEGLTRDEQGRATRFTAFTPMASGHHAPRMSAPRGRRGLWR